MINFLRISIIIGFCAIAYSCATPSSPTGGPPDEKPPEILRTEPETGTVNFDGKEIIFHFSEFVERSSLTEALVIEPQLGLIYDVDWGRKSVAIEFEDALPDSTTLIITIGTDFSDVNNNTLGSPYKVAVSTGPEIDKGKLAGKVLDARTGESTEGIKVLLYRTPVDLSLPANYISETDTSGLAKFSYLRQGDYKAFWVDDRNRNRVWDREQERAQPFRNEFVTLEKAGEDTLSTLFIAGSDTSKPNLQGVGLFSSKRMRLRFSENVMLTDSTRLRVQDSTGAAVGKAYPLYVLPAERYVLFAQNTQALAPESTFRLRVRNIADASGNVQPFDTLSFTGSAQKDTTAQRVIETSVQQGIFPDESVNTTYAKPVTSASIRDSLQVAAGDSMHTSWKSIAIQQNEVQVMPDSAWKEGVTYEFRFWNPLLENHKSVTPTIWYEKDLGGLNVMFEDSTSEAASRTTRLILKDEQNRLVKDTTFVGEIEVQGLAPINHQLILYQDLNGNGVWDPGVVQPFEAPEPYYVRNDISIQAGLIGDLSVIFEN